MVTTGAVIGALSLALNAGGPSFRVGAAAGEARAWARSAAPAPASPSAGTGSTGGRAIPDVPWLVQRPAGGWVSGHGAASTPRRLPAAETGIAVSEGWVASVVPGVDGRSTVRFRARDTTRPALEVAAPIWVSAGAWTTAGLVVTGYGDRSMTTDGGLVLLSPEGAPPTVLVAGGAFDPRLGVPVARGEVVVSPSGRLAASNACGLRLCDTQVVDVGSGTVTRPIDAGEGFLRVLTEDAIITTDADAHWISARRVADGGDVWRLPDSILLDPVATADGSVVAVTGSRRTGWGVASIDGHGTARDLGPRGVTAPWPQIWSALSGPSSVVVADRPFADWIGSSASLPVTVVDVGGPGPVSSAISVRLPAASEWSR